MNPCQCKDGSVCICNGPRKAPLFTHALPKRKPIDRSIFNDGLSALALVASCCSPASSSPLATANSAGSKAVDQNPTSCCSGSEDVPTTNLSAKAAGKRKRSPSPPGAVYKYYVAGDSDGSHQPRGYSHPLPSLPFSRLQSLPTSISDTRHSHAEPSRAGETAAGCCCGTRCECAGCQLHNVLQHRAKSWVDVEHEHNGHALSSGSIPGPGPSSTSHSSSSSSHRAQEHAGGCGSDCPTCVDHEGDVELPPLGSVHGLASTHSARRGPPPPPSFIAEYFTRHALAGLSGLATTTKTTAHGWPLAPIQEPRRMYAITHAPAPAKLEACCSGSCGCGQTCGCGYECGGCCMSHSQDPDLAPAPSSMRMRERSLSEERVGEEGMAPARARVSRSRSPSVSVSFARRSLPDEVLPEKRSCCSRN